VAAASLSLESATNVLDRKRWNQIGDLGRNLYGDLNRNSSRDHLGDLNRTLSWNHLGDLNGVHNRFHRAFDYGDAAGTAA
jgi:hypothetical protein